MLDTASQAETVTKSDTVDLAHPSRWIYVGGAGAVNLLTISGTTVTFAAVPVGTLIPIRAVRINSTSTTATNLLSLW